MRKMLFILFIVVFACNTKNKQSPESRNDINVPITENKKIDVDSTKSAPIKVDPAMKKKVVDAFALLQKYCRETKVFPKQASDNVVNCWKRIVFGKCKMGANNQMETNVEEDANAANGDLIILFEDIPLSVSEHAANTVYVGPRNALTSINGEFVKTKSISLIAGVIFHELIHQNLFISNIYQSEKDLHTKNELQAYGTQLFFLVWAYNGIIKELECFNGGEVTTNIPSTDREEFYYYFNKVKELKLLSQ